MSSEHCQQKCFWLSTHQNPLTSHDVLVSSVKSSLRNFSTTKPFYWFLFSPRPLCQSNCSKLQQNHRCNSGQFTQCTQIIQQPNKQNKHHGMERTHVPRWTCCRVWHQLISRRKCIKASGEEGETVTATQIKRRRGTGQEPGARKVLECRAQCAVCSLNTVQFALFSVHCVGSGQEPGAAYSSLCRVKHAMCSV